MLDILGIFTSSGQAPSLVGSLGLNLFSYILIQKAIYSFEIFSGVMVDGIDVLRILRVPYFCFWVIF
jgi:hypothetical protein